MGYLDYAGLQYLWSKLKEKFAPKNHSHDDRYYTESEMDGKLNSKVNNNEAGANGLINKLSTADGIPNDATVFISQHNDGKTASYYRRPISTLWTYIKSKADSVYQPKGSYAASSHTHDDRYYTETEINSKLNGKAVNITLSKVDLNTVKTPGFYNAGGGNGCTNVPVSDAFGLIVTHNANGEYYTQIFFLVDKNTSYRRYCNGGTWSGWTQDKYTDTNTWRGIQNNLTSDSTSDSLSAAQGKALKALVDGKLDKNEKAVDSAKLGGFPLNDIKKYFNGVPSIRNDGVMEVGKYIDFHTTSDDTSDYAARITAEKTGLTISGTTKGTFSGSLSGNASTATSATTASKLSTSAGSATQPVYFKDGVPVATTYTLNKTVPADAKFTDTNTWRGIQNNLTSDSADQSLSAAQGKVLKGMVDEKLGKNDKATSAATADKAAKLTTARTVSGGSDITLSFNYDGSGNSTANIGFYSCKHNVDNTNNYPFHRFARLDVNKGAWVDKSITFLISQDYSGGGYGICRLVYRSNADSGNASVDAQWLVRRGFSADTIQVAIKTDKTNGAYCDAFYKSSGTYMGVVIRAIASGGRATSGRTWTLVNSYEVDGTTATDKKTSSECWKTIADAGNELHKQAYSSSAPAINGGYVASSGTADSATTSNGVKDYNNANRTIKIGFAGAGLTSENLNYIAGYTDNGTKIKDVSKDVLKSWIGLWNYLPLIGGTMSGQITKSTGGSWIGDRDRAAIKSSYAGDSSYGAVAAMATKNGCWTMGNLGGNESLIFNYSTDAKYNAGKNETSQVYLPAQAGTIITSATIGSQSVNYANRAGNADVANSVDWSKVQNKPSSYAPASHTHDDRYYTESEVNTKLANYQPKGNYAAASHTHNYAGSGTAGGSANSAVKLDSSAGSATQPVYFKDGKPVATTYALNKTVPADAKFTDTNTWRGIQNNLTSDSTDQSLSAAQGKALKTLVDGKAPASHKHTKSQITDFPTSMPASDVSAWAKAATKPSYTKAEVGLGNVDNTADKDKSVKYATSAGSATTGLNGVSTCIFDLSSNNGSCVRFYNGLQICFGNSSKSSGVVFKLPFANDNYAVVVGGSDTLKNAWYVAGGRTTTGFNPNQSGFAVLFHWIAIGNWK